MITLATLPQATAQEVFDQVARHLLTQNARSVMEGAWRSKCAYRSDDGLKCAAGCLIDDAEYKPVMDGLSEGSAWENMVSEGLAPDVHVDLISDLQDIHDGYEPGAWFDELAMLAESKGLSTAALAKARGEQS